MASAAVGVRRESTPLSAVRVLDADPDLGAHLAPAEREAARAASRAPVIEVEPGPWPQDHGGSGGEPGSLGLLLLDGVLGARRQVERRAHLEILGPGELVRPWVELGPESLVPYDPSWTALEPTRLAVLDERFASSVARWPEVTAALMNRLVLRARRLSVQMAISFLPRVDRRALLMLWLLADRFGRVTPDGVLVGLPLTHGQIGELVGARRPSVTMALSDLRREGTIEALPGKGWLLRGRPPGELARLRRGAGLDAEKPGQEAPTG
jgi:CRP-like cAMP-binding protein